MAVTDRRFFAFDVAQSDLRSQGAYLGQSYTTEYDFNTFISAGCQIQVSNIGQWNNNQGFGGLTWWAGPLQDDSLGPVGNPSLTNDSIFTIAVASPGVDSPTPVGVTAKVTFWQTATAAVKGINPPTQFRRLAGIILQGDPTAFPDEVTAQQELFNSTFYTDAKFLPNF